MISKILSFICVILRIVFSFKKIIVFLELQDFRKTRGHARFTRSPLVIRLGDSLLRGGIEFGVAL